MDREHNQVLSYLISRHNRNMAELAEIHGAVGVGLKRSLWIVSRTLNGVIPQAPAQDLDSALQYFQTRALSAHQRPNMRRPWAADRGALELCLTAFARSRR